MTTKRDYLIGLGLAKPGRGKFSNAAKDAIAKAEADGTIFSDSSASVPAPKVKAAKVVEPKVSNSDPGVMLNEDLPHFGVDFFYRKDGKKKPLSNRTACMNCGYSLIAHQCNLPKAITPAGIVVVVEA